MLFRNNNYHGIHIAFHFTTVNVGIILQCHSIIIIINIIIIVIIIYNFFRVQKGSAWSIIC